MHRGGTAIQQAPDPGSTKKIREQGYKERMESIKSTRIARPFLQLGTLFLSSRHSFGPSSFFAKMRVIRAVTALNSSRAVASKHGARYAGLGCRAVLSTPSTQWQLSGLRHFSRSPVRTASSAAEAAYAYPNPTRMGAIDKLTHGDPG